MYNDINVVIGSWGSYNACNEKALGSKWICLNDFESWEEIEEELTKQGFKLNGIDEELFIQDIENFPANSQNWDYVNPQKLFEILKESGVLKEPKTETSKRCVTVAKTLINVLKEYRKWWLRQTNLMGDLILDDTDWLFLQHNGKVLNPSTYMQWLREVLKVAGIEHYSLHSLRHTNITMQIAAGIPLVTVSARAGHARTSTTSDIYAHFIKSSDQTAAQIVDDIFNKKPN